MKTINIMKISKYLFLLLCTFFVHSVVLAGGIYSVAGSSMGDGSGNSWANARGLTDSNALRTLIDGVSAGDSLFIGAPGDAAVTFTPTNSFPLKTGVKIFGGYYNVANSDVPPRDFSKTVLTRSARVIEAAAKADITGALYDGFTITGSISASAIYLNGVKTQEEGQPIFRNITIKECSGMAGGSIGVSLSGILTGQDNGAGSDPQYVETENKPIIFENLTLLNNTSSAAGTIYSQTSNIKFINLTAIGNKATTAGGVIYATGSALEINMGYFEGNSSTLSTGGAISTVHVPNDTHGPYFTYLTLTNVTAKNNSAGTDGGAFFVSSATNKGRSLISFKDILISDNRAGNTGNGGGLYLTSVNGGIVENAYIENNTAGYNGGGIYTTGTGALPEVTYKNLTVRYNRAGLTGGGLVNTSMSYTMEGFCFEYNWAGSDGGGIYNTSTSGMILKGVNGRINNNISGNWGGGVHFTTANVILENVEIAGNYAADRGGGLLFTTVHQHVLKNCLIADNYAGSQGGGVFLTTGYFTTNQREYINTTITNNYAKSSGGGFYFEDNVNSNITLKNSVVYGNTKGVNRDPSDFRFHNQTLNTTYSSALYSLIGAYENTSKMALDPASNNLFGQDPQFLRPADMQGLSGATVANGVITYGTTSNGEDFVLGNYRQTETSPLIDAGDNILSAGMPFDMDGRERIQNSTIDLGPYEGTGGEPYFECYEYCFPVMVWLGKTDDWHDINNWYPAGIPADCSDVYIPGKSTLGLAEDDYHFPLLSEVQAANVCNRIFFSPGAQLGRPDLLIYSEAHVQINYSGKSSTSGNDWTPLSATELVYKGGGHREQVQSLITSKDWIDFGATNTKTTLQRGRWNMLSAPLKEMYTGDFAFGGFPFSFIKKYDPDGTSESYIKGNWANYDSETDLQFQPGQGFGHFYYPYLPTGTPYGMDRSNDAQWNAAVNAAELTADKPKHLVIDGAEFGLAKTAGILHYPYFFDGSSDEWDGLSKPHRAHEYTPVYGDLVVPGSSTFHFYYEDPLTSFKFLQPKNQSETVDRTEKAFRFIAEGESGDMAFAYNPGNSFTQENSIVLLGNPYMGALDFDLFHEHNKNEIKKIYQIYDGGDGTYFSYIGDGSANRLIAPMQSFLVELTDEAISLAQSGNLQLVFNPTIAVVNEKTMLRSSAPSVDRLSISASNPNGKSTAWLRRSGDALDAFCAMDFSKIIDNPTNRPEVYTLVNRENGKARALLMNAVESDDIIVPVGFLSTYKGENTLCIEGMDQYQANVFWVDSKDGEVIDITGKERFNYVFTSAPQEIGRTIENRFSLRFTPLNTSSIDDNTLDSKIVAYVSGSDIIVYSSTQDPIRLLSVYDMQGRQLARQNAINASSCQLTNLLQTPGVYIVRVHTKQGVKSIKIAKE